MLPAGDIRLRTWTGGPSDNAPPIVLVHGIVASGRYMLPTARLLAAQYRVYAPDLPGYGKSDTPPTPPTPTLLADSLAAFMEDNGIRNATLLGNSYGSQIVLRLAHRHSGVAVRLVLVGPTIDRHARHIVRQASRLALDITRESLSLPLVLVGDVIDLGLPRAVGAIRAMMDDRPEDILPLLDLPALVVRGEHDSIVPHTWASEVACLLPQGRLVTIPRGSHALNYSNPRELADIVRIFIEESAEETTPT